MINWEKDADGVVILTMDDKSQGANTMNQTFMDSIAATVDRLEAEKDDITGVVITSAKKTFFAGGDLKDMTAEQTQTKEEIATAITERTNGMKKVLRRLETLGKPVVAAINGAALGGGLELALHTHHRIAADIKVSRSVCPRSPSVCCPVRWRRAYRASARLPGRADERAPAGPAVQRRQGQGDRSRR